MQEEPTAGPSGSAAVPGLERVKLDMSEAVAEEAVRRDDELGLVDTALGRTLRPVLRRCDEVLSRPDSVRVSAITAGQRRRLGRSVGRPAVWPLLARLRRRSAAVRSVRAALVLFYKHISRLVN